VLVLAPVIAVTGGVLGAGGKGTGLALGQCVYLLAATAALVRGAEPWLLVALLPGAGASTIQLWMGGPVHPVVWIAWAVTIAATIAVAIVHTREERQAEVRRRCARREVVAALPFALFGLLAGGLLTFGTVSTLLRLSHTSHATTMGVLALSLSMGPAEWILFSYRRRVHRLLVTRASMRRFAWSARGVLGVAVAAYAAGLVALGAVIVAVAGSIGHTLDGLAEAAATPWIAGANLSLGCAFFVALLLQSCGRIRPVVAICAVALAAEAAATLALGPGMVQLAIQFATAAGLCAALLTYALVVLGRATSYR
jgi:hypothetical protein